MTHIPSYPKIYNLGHRYISELFLDEVVIQEKVDGSQFSFARIGGELYCRSKGATLNIDAPASLFAEAVATARECFRLIPEGTVFRGECLKKPKHNTLAYDRTPRRNVVLFDVDAGGENYSTPEVVSEWAARLDLECIPTFAVRRLDSVDDVLALMETVSFLGGQKIEGLVFKNYGRFGVDGKALMGKYVSERFKEVHRKDWKVREPAGKDVKALLTEQYRSEARWDKAVQHLRDRGELTNTPRDIGPLLKEIQSDIEAECADEIKETLWRWARKDILRSAGYGAPEWYKQRLAAQQFEGD